MLGDIKPDRAVCGLARTGPGGARLGLLFGHGRVKPVRVHGTALFTQRILRQVQRETIGIIQLERRLPCQRGAIIQPVQLFVQKLQPTVQCLLEPGFFQLQCLLDQCLRLPQFRIGRAHLADQRGHQPVHHRVFCAQKMRMAHRAPHDTAQHIAAPVIAGHHPVRDQKRGRTQVIRDHPVMNVLVPKRFARCHMRRGLDQIFEQIGVVIVMAPLQQRADPLQPHAGIDRLHVQRPHRAVLELLVLHEDNVPDLDEPVAILFRAARRPAPDVIAMVKKDLRARPARAGRAHLPEIVRRGDTDDPILGYANLLPDFKGFVVRVIHRRVQPALVDTEIPGNQFPGEPDRVVLEIIPERKIAQHLEKRVVARGIAHIVQIIVLASGANTFLAGRGALVVAMLHPGEQVLELNHPGIGEHQCRIIARYQRRRGNNLVPLLGKVVQKGRPDVVQTGHIAGSLAESFAYRAGL